VATTPKEAPDQESVELFQSKTSPSGSESQNLSFGASAEEGFGASPEEGLDASPKAAPNEKDGQAPLDAKPKDTGQKNQVADDNADSLSSLLSQALSGTGPGPGPVQAAPLEPALATTGEASLNDPNVSELAEKILAKVLVAASGPSGAEARLTVDPAILPDVEIRLNRGPDGFLNVALVSSDPNSLQTLTQARADLELALSKTEGAGFRLTVLDEKMDDLSGSKDQNGQSRGLDFMDES
jgi:hypothetical protein